MIPDFNAAPRILIAGVGNFSTGHDQFGSELVRALAHLQWPEGVRVADFGIRGIDLTYALAEEADVAILVDTAPHGKEPGTLQVVRPDDPDDLARTSDALAAGLSPRPGLTPASVIRLVRALGGKLRDALLVECEPSTVRSAAKETARRVQALVNKIREGDIGQLFQGNRDHDSAGMIGLV